MTAIEVAGSVIFKGSGALARVVSIPQRRRYGTKVARETCYGGANWMTVVSSEFSPAIRASELWEEGSMKFMAYPWHAYTFIQ